MFQDQLTALVVYIQYTPVYLSLLPVYSSITPFFIVNSSISQFQYSDSNQWTVVFQDQLTALVVYIQYTPVYLSLLPVNSSITPFFIVNSSISQFQYSDSNQWTVVFQDQLTALVVYIQYTPVYLSLFPVYSSITPFL